MTFAISKLIPGGTWTTQESVLDKNWFHIILDSSRVTASYIANILYCHSYSFELNENNTACDGIVNFKDQGPKKFMENVYKIFSVKIIKNQGS